MRKTEAQRIEHAMNAAKRLTAEIRGTSINAPHISEMCEEIIAVHGDLKTFAKRYKQNFDAAESKEHGMGSKTVMDNYWRVVQLVAMSTEHRDSAPDVANLSNEDIEAELANMLLKATGLKVVSPDDGDETQDARRA